VTGGRDAKLRSGTPCGTVATNRACGSASRWELLIETTGTLGKTLNIGCSSGRSSRPCSVVTNGTCCRLNVENGQ
jgi:hypothetical protein